MKPVNLKNILKYLTILSMVMITAACNSSTRKGTEIASADHIEIAENKQEKEVASALADQNTDLEVAPEIRKIIDRGKLRVGLYSEDMPPFIMTDKNGKLYGYDIDIADKIAKCLNVEIEFDRNSSTYQELYEKAVRGEVDIIISKFSITLDRAIYLRFTDPYLEMHRALLVNREFALKNKIEEYPVDYMKKNNISIGVKSKTSYVSFAKELFPDANLVELPEWGDVVNLLIEGKIDAAMYDELEVDKLIRKNPDISLYASAYILTDQKDMISMAVPYKSTQFLSWLNCLIEYQSIKTDVNTMIENYPEVFTEN